MLKLAQHKDTLTQSDADIYTQTLQWVEDDALLDAFGLSLLKLELSAHTYAPAVVAQYQLYNATVVPEIIRVRGTEGFDESCGVWAQYKDKQACSVDALEEILNSERFYGTTYVEEAKVEPQVLDSDHVYLSDGAKLVVLYGDPRADGFTEFHEHLQQLADNQEISYVLRYRPWSGDSDRALGLAGYGAELALKSTEYKVIDDRDLGANGDHSDSASAPKLAEQGEGAFERLFEAEAEPVVKGLTEKQALALDVQATQMILAADDKLAVLRQLSQNLPRYAHLLAEMPLNDTLVADIGSDWRKGMQDMVAINGLKLRGEDMDPFHLLEHIRKETSVVEALQGAGLSQSQALDVLMDGSEDTGEDQTESVSFDVRERPNEKKTILWFNDLEKDRRYSHWPSDLSKLKAITGPRMAGPLRRNVVQAVLSIDLSTVEGWISVFEDVLGNIDGGIPMQFGLVPLIDYSAPDEPSGPNQMAKFVLYLRRAFKRTAWESLVKSTLISHLRSRNNAPGALVDDMRQAYETYIKTHSTKDGEQALEWSRVVGGTVPWLAKRWQSTVDYCARLDLSPASAPSGLAFINGVQLPLADGLQQRLFKEFQLQTWVVASALREGTLADEGDIQDYVYGELGVGSRNSLVYESDEAPLRFLDLGSRQVQAWMDDEVQYLDFGVSSAGNGSSGDEKLASVWIIGDFASRDVRAVASRALVAARKENRMRVALVHAGFEQQAQEQADRAEGEDDGEVPDGHDVDAPQTIFQLVSSMPEFADEHEVLADYVARFLVDRESAMAALSGLGDEGGDRITSLSEPLGEMADEAEQVFAENRKALGPLDALPTSPQACHIVINGRILPAIMPETSFSDDAFILLAKRELRERIGPIRRALSEAASVDPKDIPDLVLKATSIVEHGKVLFGSGNSGVFRRRRQSGVRMDFSTQLPTTTDTYLSFNDVEGARILIQAVLDPLSENAQKWVPLFETLLSLPDVALELWLNPRPEIGELPVKRFYRYLWPSSLKFDASGNVADPEVVFDGIPADPLLTLGMDVPTAWLVTATESIEDLDNIRLSSLPASRIGGISATYTLAHILVEGHLVDTNDRSPVRGLEVQLGTPLYPAMTDTIVMANLGYLQLKANPGVWQFAIRPGRSADICKIDHVGQGRWNYAAAKQADGEGGRRPVLVTSFTGTTIFPLVSKRAGKEGEDVLQSDSTAAPTPEKPSGGIWGKLKGALGSGDAPERPHFDVFAVASGHLYERLMSIMMLSVLNTTESSVKFWLIENFLSPSFKAFVPDMAEEFGFDYEFVTYKWPHWLSHETEKQRTIWGYKILFLDVLFPLDLDRVIFVDADQIVRTDLQELADMDLQGAPYGYTPFCDDRPEIDGYRFWKQGWWKSHLRGKPYHISALYVVDLKRFRQMAAGDRMRGQYQALSQDGGSLANLDQDLPNNMQHIVPIFSLPQEWLWCETWCSDAGLKTAKTIDLCNNPMTKEPKLERARRLLPEWEVFDSQVANFSRVLAQRGNHEGAQIADAEAVAIDKPVDKLTDKPTDKVTDKPTDEAHDEL
ncbi:killer toxin resistant protein [Coemansia sp. RSA 552]|nr:killer toxin resistant protein [Coemansia sp. RSA 552]